MDGTIRPKQMIQMMSTGKTFEVTEIGVLNPDMQSVECLQAGEVGYIAASIKNVVDTRVGDTITDAKKPAGEPLPGYKKAVPMVFCGMYPAEGEEYENLKEALGKLQLSDASLFFEPETSAALGFGFRCGFLGLLHMDVVQERLEREYNLNLLTTAPSVIFKINKTDGHKIDVDNPTNFPDSAEIEYIEEPYVEASIMLPTEYVGTVMDLCQEKRGTMKDMEYINEKRVILRYEMPLSEIIYDLFDQLKSRTRGYASLDYELTGYKKSEMEKLDILLNGEVVDALSFIVHKDKAYNRGRQITEKLKEVIPRHMFEVPIQAAIGGKIIARETVRALRKNVLAKCYGGDISRKKKLLEKQKEGKKRMRQIGNVELPQEAFMAVLKME
jgi:GTP-binding protein LepA